MNDIRLVIGDKNYSSWSLCPWLLLKMFNVDFEEICIPLYQKNTAEKLGPYSPSLKVPVLLHKEISVWDSMAICEYISAEILGDAGWPTNRRKRASARSVSAEVHADFPVLKRDWPMNCKSQFKPKPSDQLLDEIARIDAISLTDMARMVSVGVRVTPNAFEIATITSICSRESHPATFATPESRPMVSRGNTEEMTDTISASVNFRAGEGQCRTSSW